MSEIRSKPSTKIISGDCLEVLKSLDDNSIDAVITDPPYGLSFMGKKWDYDVPSVEVWRECLRVLKPGGHLLSFAGTRTQHRMAVNIEDAGFEIRDMIAWVYGSGFPKSLNIGKAVDKLQGNEVKTTYVPNHKNDKYGKGMGGGVTDNTPSDNEYNGWGTALKPALEPITLARKPIEKGLSIAENCLKWGVGGINIDECRVESNETIKVSGDLKQLQKWKEQDGRIKKDKDLIINKPYEHNLGRFPANLIHDGSQEVLELFPMTGGGKFTNKKRERNKGWCNSSPGDGVDAIDNYGDSGSAARFFYCPKASKSERNRGCEGLEEKRSGSMMGCVDDGNFLTGSGNPREGKYHNNHPTVKPIALMEYLVKLVSREGQTVLDPFAGSGTTGIACKNLNRNAILIEREAEYVEIAKCRIAV